MRTNQELFDAVVKHLQTQGEPAYSQTLEGCFYRLKHVDGTVTKCAIGGLIPDDKYCESFEHKGISAGYDNRDKPQWNTNILDAASILPGQYKLALDLQVAHDEWGNGADLTSLLTKVAKDHNLSTSEVK